MSRRLKTIARMAALATITVGGIPAAGNATAPPAPKGTRNIPVHATFEVHQGEESDEPVGRGAIHGVRRVDGGTVLYYSLGFPERYGSDVSFLYTHRQTQTNDRWRAVGSSWATPTLVDAAGKRAYTTLVEEEQGDCLCSLTDATEDESGKMFVLYSVFPPLHPQARTVTVTVGHSTVVTGVPVEDGPLAPAVDPARPIVLGDGWPLVDMNAVAAAPDKDRSIADLETRVTDFVNRVTKVESPGQVSLELSADVLFALDSAVLTHRPRRASPRWLKR